ncbi:MAG: phosphotransferase [Deltaproteobacteria bacterium]|nr:phosphotransferase [Deltaproteobacteria bacterium]MCB9785649.1 phosphotransferase [Deltaproteobacteria bacterium]
MAREALAAITEQGVERWLRGHGHADARITSMKALGEGPEGGKAYGYGRPIRIRFDAGGVSHDVVLRTMSPDPFGHDRRADRVAQMVLCQDTFDTIPRHIRPWACGALDAEGRLHTLPGGEPFLLTDYVEGELYAPHLQRVAALDEAPPAELALARSLALYLAELHAEPAPPEAWTRALRDAVGSGEGIFGLCDAWPAGHPVGTSERLLAIQEQAVRWRWRLSGRTHRARRVHGDFHPFNLLVRGGGDFSVLDCSRGGRGEPADDVTCLSLNYLFFALLERGELGGAPLALWHRFWGTYLEASGDLELLEVVAPFFAWRTLVVASPVWYPDVADATRDRLLRFAERLLAGEPFDPARVEELCA